MDDLTLNEMSQFKRNVTIMRICETLNDRKYFYNFGDFPVKS